jgi:glutathione S-transferase
MNESQYHRFGNPSRVRITWDWYKLIGKTPAERDTIIQWLTFKMNGVGPMFGQIGYFNKFSGQAV